MLKKNSREFQVDVNKDFYLPGEEITGTVKLDPRKALSLTQLKIYFTGDEYCVWTDRVAARMGQPVQPTKCPLFKKECVLVNDRTKLELREHTWGFRFTIPRSVPPTLLQKKGQAKVGYWLKVRASTGIGHFDMHYKIPVIIGQLRIPTTPSPKRATYKTAGGNLSIEAVASRTIAKAGQIVKVNLHINNTSHRNIEGVRLKLKQIWEVSGVPHHKEVEARTVIKEGFPIGRGVHDCTIQLEVPASLRAVPTVTNANMFKVTYYLGVYGVTKMAGLMEKESVKCHLPIDISSTPLTPEDFEPVNPPPIVPRATQAGGPATAPSGRSSTTTSTSSSAPRPSTSLPHRSQSVLDFQNDDNENDYLYGRRALTRSRSATIDNIFFGLNNVDLGARSNNAGSRTNNTTSSTTTAPPTNTTATGARNNGWSVVSDEPSRNVNGNSAMDAQGNLIDPFAEPEQTHDHAHDHDHDHENDHGGSSTSSKNECVVCFDGAKNMLLLPCAHIATCVSCTTYIMNSTKQCPVCRTKITQVVRTYAV